MSTSSEKRAAISEWANSRQGDNKLGKWAKRNLDALAARIDDTGEKIGYAIKNLFDESKGMDISTGGEEKQSLQNGINLARTHQMDSGASILESGDQPRQTGGQNVPRRGQEDQSILRFDDEPTDTPTGTTPSQNPRQGRPASILESGVEAESGGGWVDDVSRRDNADLTSPNESEKKLQQFLSDEGADIKADGYWGPQTDKALQNFQSQNGLKATGTLDMETRDLIKQKMNRAA